VQAILQEMAASIRAPPYLLEQMFPRLRETLGTALDLVVEFSTLGEYRLDAIGAPDPAGAPAAALEPTSQRGGNGLVAAVAAERFAAGGAATSGTLRASAATPAARRLQANGAAAPRDDRPRRHAGEAPQPCHGARSRRTREAPSAPRRGGSSVPAVSEQLCFAGL
jgi:hypothetical protein